MTGLQISWHDALMKMSSPIHEDCQRMVNLGLMRFSGNQHNEAWEWIPSEVAKLTDARAEMHYRNITCQHR